MLKLEDIMFDVTTDATDTVLLFRRKKTIDYYLLNVLNMKQPALVGHASCVVFERHRKDNILDLSLKDF